MQKTNLLFAFILIFNFQYLIGNLQAQTSIHQQQLTYYNSLGNADANYYEQHTTAAKMQQKNQKLTCSLNKVVYGWHPYWVGNAYLNYDWDLLSHFSFFSYEVDAATGNPNSTHGWATSAAVDAALASGNTKVTLTATLFSGHATFFNSSTAQQTLITNLINLIQSRGAHGVNIDVEGLPATYKTAFTNFMINLSNQMHAAIPNSEVSTVLYAVDWNNVFDFTNMGSVVDHFIIMGYDYYWSGSTTAGPNDPLYHFSTTYNYNLSRSITYYLNKGCPKNKLILGLPYYGREWPTASATVPSSTTGNGIARTYQVVKNNASGNYSAANYQYDNDSYSDIYVFNSGGQKQCFISLENSLRKRMEHINTTGIGGMGMWALGYDDGYPDLWDAIQDYMTTCFAYPCSGTIHDFGGPTKNYYDNENYTWTIAPTGAASINVNFTSFDVEANWDYLYIYDGATIAAPQITGSPFTGTTLPPNFTSSTGALTFRFTSDGSTVRPGFVANYSCAIDNIAPTTSVSAPTGWVTSNFTANFTDADNTGGSGIQKRYYQVIDYDGTEWRANANNGFFADNFATNIHSEWNQVVGVWSINSGALYQSDENEGNTNISAALNQSLSNRHLYHFKARINGSGTNRRAGFHFFADDDTLTNRGNSYFVWFRVDDAKLQIYKVVNDVFGPPVLDMPLTTVAGQLYDYKVIYDRISGDMIIYRDDTYITSWTDSSPLATGNYISFRSGNANMSVAELKVYRSRYPSVTVTVGNPTTSDIRYQNPNPSTPSGKVKSLVDDNANNISVIAEQLVNVDWTSPLSFTTNDGTAADIDTTNTNTQLSANWNTTTDPHSNVVAYWYAIGTTAGDSNVVSWTNNGMNIAITHTGLSVPFNQDYYFSIRAENGAGLLIQIPTDGQWVVMATGINEIATASFSAYPNPFTEQLRIELKQAQATAISLYDNSGKLIFTKNINNTTIIDMSTYQLKAGNYHLVIESNNKTDVVKLLKQ